MNKLSTSVFWFRRDLRLEDNAGLFHALKENECVLPIFIFDTAILNQLEDRNDRRVDFIHQALHHLQKQLQELGSSLHVFYSTPTSVFTELATTYSISSVYTNHDYEPYAIVRDEEIANLLKQHNCTFNTYKDQCIFEKNEVTKDDGKPYTIFTPYSNKWKSKLKPEHYRSYKTEDQFKNFIPLKPISIPTLKQLGFTKTDMVFLPPAPVKPILLEHYKAQRDYPAVAGTSRMSMHLRFGTVSVRALVQQCITKSETWLNELIWREFYMMILWQFPHVVNNAFKPKYNFIAWRNNEHQFEKWCKGETGFPIVDAGMRELNTTGFMHNRVRMIVSSFLIKDLLIDWRWGEAYFAKKLNDFDLSANNGGWQWAASSGCDAAPYFRIFNPTEQQKRFDPDLEYIKKWIPEFGTTSYPLPMIDHASARLRTLAVYKEALSEIKQGNLFA
jgi:deoxyribodipyrimidine photo-lyase